MIRQSAQPYAEILAEPTANINRANHVLLLWPYHDPEKAAKTKPAEEQGGDEIADAIKEASDAE